MNIALIACVIVCRKIALTCVCFFISHTYIYGVCVYTLFVYILSVCVSGVIWIILKHLTQTNIIYSVDGFDTVALSNILHIYIYIKRTESVFKFGKVGLKLHMSIDVYL